MAASDEEVSTAAAAGKKRLSCDAEGEEEEVPKTKKVKGGDEDDVGAGAEGKSADGWDVEECRGDHESVEHWELRKQFLVENMDRFPDKNRLICLSQVFANMEFLGCRYPEETMELVHELSLGIVESYREKQKNRLQRTFVKASDAAERKTKGASSSSNYTNKNGNTQSSASKFDQDKPSFSMNKQQAHSSSSSSNLHASRPSSSSLSTPAFDKFSQSEPFWKMILLVFTYNECENCVQILHRSCSSVKIPISLDYQQTLKGSTYHYSCTYQIGLNFKVSSSDIHVTKDGAKDEAAKLAFLRLQEICYTFVTKVKNAPNFVEGKEIAKDELDGGAAAKVDGDLRKEEENIGNKLLKLMGWTGGGLGKNEQGIHEAISANGTVGRSRLGLGNKGGATFQKKIWDLLESQKKAGFSHDLKFASDFSKDERAEIHMIAKKVGLKSRSYGKDPDRFIVVSEKVSRANLLKSTLAEGGETDQYLVIPPGGCVEKIRHLIEY